MDCAQELCRQSYLEDRRSRLNDFFQLLLDELNEVAHPCAPRYIVSPTRNPSSNLLAVGSERLEIQQHPSRSATSTLMHPCAPIFTLAGRIGRRIADSIPYI